MGESAGTLVEVFRGTLADHGDRIALEFGEEKLTYRELWRRSGAVARMLTDRGVGPGDRIVLFLPRGTDMFAAMLGVLLSGAAYVPCDPRFPWDRVLGIVKDSGAKLLVTASDLPSQPTVPRLLLDDVRADLAALDLTHWKPPTPPGPDDVAYVIYTSGSSGKPKGVLVPHRCAAAFVAAEGSVLDLRATDVVYQGFSLSFDMSVEEIWTAFAAGATLFVGDSATVLGGPGLGAYLARRGVTVLHCVPTLLAMQEQEIASLRLLNLGGEPCPPELVTRWARPGRRVLNTYGPTETTVTATYAELTPGDPVTIGRPLPGYAAFVVDEHLRPVADGTEGELCIGGVGVAAGYLNDPDLTSKKFVELALDGGAKQRIYRTGDRVRRDAEGRLVFLGRIDEQVKIRGYRVELAEVDGALAAASGYPAATALVADREGIATLVGYLVAPSGAALDAQKIDQGLRRALPPYMIPALLTTVADLPRLPSGKLDRKRLPFPDSALPMREGGVPPRTLTELRIHGVWTEVFAPRRVSIDDDFFLDLGGHSLRASVAVSRCRAIRGLERLAVGDLYAHPTIRDLAAWLDANAEAGLAPPPVPAAPFTAVPPGRYWACATAQTAVLPLLFGVFGLQWLFPYLAYSSLINAEEPRALALATALVGYAAAVPLSALLAILVKWLVLGRLEPGDYPMWGSVYFRWWLVRRVMGLVPTYLFAGSPWFGIYLKLLGAKIGRGVFLGMYRVDAPDLLEVGDGSSLGFGAAIGTCAVEGGMFRVRRTTVGRDARVGNAATLGLGSAVGDGATLEDLSALSESAHVPAGERWEGAPARRVTARPRPEAAPRPTLLSEVSYSLCYLPFVLVMPLAAIAPIMPGLMVLSELDRHTEGYGFLWAAPLLALIFVVATCVQAVVFKWLLLGRMKAGTVSIRSFSYLRYWLVSRLMEIGLDFVKPLYATLYLAPWYRLLGIAVAPRSEVSTASSVAFDLLTLGEECFIADGVSLGAPRFDRGTGTFAATSVGRRSFLGNSAVVPGGTRIGENVLVGVLSKAPEATEPGKSWFGSPPIALPKRQVLTQFDEGSTFRPPRRLVHLRLAVEAVRILLPLSCIILLSSVLISELVDLQQDSFLPLPMVLGFPFLSMLVGVTAAILTAFVKLVVVGRYVPRIAPLWSLFVWRSELVTCLYENLMVPLLLEHLRGTPWINFYLRLLGTRVGARVYTDTTDITEHDVVEVGDDVALNEDCGLQTHLFEDRIMKIGRVKIGARSSVGSNAIVLYDAVLEPDVVLGDLTLVMKGEVVPERSRWEGSPAAPMRG